MFVDIRGNFSKLENAEMMIQNIRAPFEDAYGRFIKNAKDHAKKRIVDFQAKKAVEIDQAKKDEKLKIYSNDYSKFNNIDVSDSD